MKQIKKLSLSNVIGKLTRNEMRYIMAGSGRVWCVCNQVNIGWVADADVCAAKCKELNP